MPSMFAPNPHLLTAQRRVLEITLELIELVAMEEELIPNTGVGEMYVTFQRVKGQHLQRAIQTLLRVIQQRDEEPLTAFVTRR